MAIGALLGAATPTLADTAEISVLTTAGQPDPAASVPRIFTISGSTTVPKSVYIKYRAPGGAPCAPTAHSDSGDLFDGSYGESYRWGVDVDGAFRLQTVQTWNTAGDVFFCIWLAGSSGEIATPIAQTITFRGPSGSISATVNPTTPRPRQRTTIAIAGSTETPAEVYAKLRSAGGAPCAPTASTDSGDYLVSGTSVDGAFSIPVETRQPSGTYVVCMWLADSSTDATPIAGPQAATFTVAAPAAPAAAPAPSCVVPKLGRKRAVAVIKRRIRARNCRVGRTIRVHSRARRGKVLRLIPKSGRRLRAQARVDLIVSRGRRVHRNRRR